LSEKEADAHFSFYLPIWSLDMIKISNPFKNILSCKILVKAGKLQKWLLGPPSIEIQEFLIFTEFKGMTQILIDMGSRKGRECNEPTR
jgi:hypothetical protein